MDEILAAYDSREGRAAFLIAQLWRAASQKHASESVWAEYAAKKALLEHPAVEFLDGGSDYDLLFRSEN